MDRVREDLQFLGVVGIVGEAFRILRSFAKLLGTLTVTLIFPLSFAMLGKPLLSKYLSNEIRWNGTYYEVEAGERSMRVWMEFLLFLASYEIFVSAFSLLSTTAVVYTVASIYRGEEISYGRAMSIVPRVWKRLMVTFLWFFIIVLVYSQVALVIAFTITSVVFIAQLIIFCGNVYINMVCHLACVISVQEDNYGWGAMRRSKNLIRRNLTTAYVLNMLFLIFFYTTVWFFNYVYRHGVGSVARGAYETVLVGLLCLVILMRLLTYSVFYFVCTSYHIA